MDLENINIDIDIENIILEYKEIDKNGSTELFDINNELLKLHDKLNQNALKMNICNINNVDTTIEEIALYTVKQLMIICDYYDISKCIKMCKFKKQDIIETIITFEIDILNFEIVNKRRLLWKYLNELKNDKLMKRFIIW